MKMKQKLLMASGLSAIAVSAALALAKEVDLRPVIVTDVAGAVRILQNLPCGDPVDRTQPLKSGRIEIVPGEGLRVRGGATLFQLTQFTAIFEPFRGERTCFDIRQSIDFTEIGVRLVNTAPIRGVKRENKYFFTIPKDQFTIFQSVIENGQSDTQYKRPAQDVTGEIDVKLGTVRFHLVFASRLSFPGGCPSGPGPSCSTPALLFDGTQTVDIFGRNFFPDGDGDRVPDQIDNCPMVANPTQVPVATPLLVPPANLTLNSCLDRQIGRARATDICADRAVKITSDAPKKFAPGRNLVTWSGDDRVNPIVTGQQIVTLVDTTLPTVACKAQRPAGRFKVSAADDCGPAVIHFGDFILANGEVIQIQLSATPGVRYIGTFGGVRYFDVGRADANIVATDPANNIATAACQ